MSKRSARFNNKTTVILCLLACLLACLSAPCRPLPAEEAGGFSFSGIFPGLSYSNDEDECGTGAVVPWADRLWLITYGPHCPFGSSDILGEVTPEPALKVHPASVGGTHAGRMIHDPSRQLFLGPYVIDREGKVRVIPPGRMPGRLTGFARHLSEPERKILCATMEEGFYEIDVKTLEAVELWRDTNVNPDDPRTPDRVIRAMPGRGEDILPGYHGKGFYSGQGRLVYANNGEQTPEALVDPTIPAGALGQWFFPKPGEEPLRWETVLRAQCCEVTSRGGIHSGGADDDPIWVSGWDDRSVFVMLLDGGKWTKYRLPKGSRCYDGAHGWNTEWPRIRNIAPGAAALGASAPSGPLLMTMHGMFWDFPADFSASRAAGIRPKSAYLKVIGDFCRWDAFGDGRWIVCGCDDAARSEFINKRRYKGTLCAPGRSQSNLWFVRPETLSCLGPPYAAGALWKNYAVEANLPSDPILFAGWPKRALFVDLGDGQSAAVTVEIDRAGDGRWETLQTAALPEGRGFWEFDRAVPGEWIRVKADRSGTSASAYLVCLPDDSRGTVSEEIFSGFPEVGSPIPGRSLLWSDAERALRVVTDRPDGGQKGFMVDLAPGGGRFAVRPMDEATARETAGKVPLPEVCPEVTADKVTITDDHGKCFLLPVTDRWRALSDRGRAEENRCRHDREVCTERDLFHAAGTFYELPAENAGGFWGIRPIASHPLRVDDYASWRGLLVLSVGLRQEEVNTQGGAQEMNGRWLRLDENHALWFGAVDDLWRLGRPTGRIGLWSRQPVNAEVPSDPCLAHGYAAKHVRIERHDEGPSARVRLEADFAGQGIFHEVKCYTLAGGQVIDETLPESLGAFWLRLVPEEDTVLSAEFCYE